MKLAAAAAVVAVLTFGVTAVSAGTIPTGWSWVNPPVPAHVAVVGDSLVYQAEHGSLPDPYYQQHQLTDAINAMGRAARVAARSAADTRSLAMWGGWASRPEVLVVALGTNDAIGAYTGTMTIAQSLARLDAYLAIVKPVCTVIVGVVTTGYRHLDVYGPTWNAEVAKRATVFVNWAALVQPGDLTADQTHHTTQGQAHYRQAITEGIQQCP